MFGNWKFKDYCSFHHIAICNTNTLLHQAVIVMNGHVCNVVLESESVRVSVDIHTYIHIYSHINTNTCVHFEPPSSANHSFAFRLKNSAWLQKNRLSWKPLFILVASLFQASKEASPMEHERYGENFLFYLLADALIPRNRVTVTCKINGKLGGKGPLAR